MVAGALALTSFAFAAAPAAASSPARYKPPTSPVCLNFAKMAKKEALAELTASIQISPTEGQTLTNYFNADIAQIDADLIQCNLARQWLDLSVVSNPFADIGSGAPASAPAGPPAPAAGGPSVAPGSAPAPSGTGERKVGPGRQMLNGTERIAAEDGGATYTWSASMSMKFPNGNVVTRQAKASTELITIVIGNAQVSGEDNNVYIVYSDFNSPFGSYNWVDNRPGQMTYTEALSLTAFKEQVTYSHKANCGSGCKTVHVVVLNTAGVILYEGDL